MEPTPNLPAIRALRPAWNKGRIVGQKRPLKPKYVWAIRVRLELAENHRDLALFNMAIDSKLRGCDLVKMKVVDVMASGQIKERASVLQSKTQKPVRFEISEGTRASVEKWMEDELMVGSEYLWPGRFHERLHISTRQYSQVNLPVKCSLPFVVLFWTGNGRLENHRIGLQYTYFGTGQFAFDLTDNTAAIDSQTAGFVAGADIDTLRSWRTGLFGGYGTTSLTLDEQESSGDVGSFLLGAYAGYQLNEFDFRFGASNAWHNVTTNRDVTIGSFSDEVSADYAATTFQAFGEVGYTHTTRLARLEPFSGLALINQRTQDFVEEGDAAALRANSASQAVGVFSLGTRFERQFQVFGSGVTLLNGSLGWRHAFGDVDPAKTMRFDDDAVFAIEGAPVEQDTFLVDVGLRHEIDGVFFDVGYHSAFGDLAQNQGFSINASFTF